MEDKKFILSIGCHRGTLISRDSEMREFDTYDEAYNSYTESKKTWKRFGYMVWFSKIIAPDGIETNLESNAYY